MSMKICSEGAVLLTLDEILTGLRHFLLISGNSSLMVLVLLNYKYSVNSLSKSLTFSSVQSLSRVWLCDPVNRSTPGLPVHHHLLEFTQTHVNLHSNILIFVEGMVGWHHWVNGQEFEQAPGDGKGQQSLVCCSQWAHKELDMIEQLKNNNKSKVQLTVDSFPLPYLRPVADGNLWSNKEKIVYSASFFHPSSYLTSSTL